MRTFVISDIHGNDRLFRKALKTVGLRKTDKVILIGDVIDRGAQSKEVLDTILLLQENNFEIICIMGNHEDMFLKSFEDDATLYQWLKNGGEDTLFSFLTDSIEKIPKKYIDLIRSFPYYHIHNEFILVHAGLNTKTSHPFEDLETILWARNAKELLSSDWDKNRFIIHGHTPVSRDIILSDLKNRENVIGIDNGIYFKKQNFGSLSILNLETLEIHFINESN